MAINPAQAPINYSASIPPISIGQSINDLGAALQARRVRAQEEQAKIQAQQAREAFSNDLAGALSKGDQSAWSSMIAKYPQFREAFGDVRKNIGDENIGREFVIGFEISNAIENNAPDVAMQRLSAIIEAKKAKGETAGIYEQVYKSLESGDIKGAQSNVNMSLALLDPDRYEKFTKAKFSTPKAEQELKKLTGEAAKVGAEATTAQVQAKYAESKALQELEKTGWDIKKVQADMAFQRESNRIAAMNAAASREGNSLKRQELQLKVQDAISKRDEGIRAKVAEVEAGRFNIDNMLNTADRILANPELDSVLGTVQGRLPVVLSDKAQDAVALIDTLGSQAFLSQIPNVKGMGALSNTEGEKLQNAFQNLGRVQSEAQFKTNLKEAQRLLLKARKNMADRYGVPDTPADTPAAKPAPGKSVDDILKELGVQ